MNKRDFMLGACAMVGAAGTARGYAQVSGPGAGLVGMARPPELMPDLEMSTWQHYLGDAFAVPGGRLRLTGLQVQPQPGAPGGAKTEQFSLVFAGAVVLAAGMHQLRHGTGQRLGLFLQPAGVSSQGHAQYRADFNRLT